MHRIFIAINLSENIIGKLVICQEKITAAFSGRCPVTWTKKENLHITLAFVGTATNDELLEICNLARKVGAKHQPFDVSLSRILYGPANANPPRMVWVEGEKSAALTLLENDIENTLGESGSANYQPENRAFTPHITLGRIKAWQFRQIEPEEIPEIEEEFSQTFTVRSIEVMDSELKRGGPNYAVLESIPLGVAKES